MSSPDSRFLVKCRFRIKNNNATDMYVNITLSSNRFCYLFDKAILRLRSNCVKHVKNVGIVTDVFYQIDDSEFRHKIGKMVGLIEDSSNAIFDTIGSRFGDITGNDVGGIVASVNKANQRNIKTNENYKKG